MVDGSLGPHPPQGGLIISLGTGAAPVLLAGLLDERRPPAQGVDDGFLWIQRVPGVGRGPERHPHRLVIEAALPAMPQREHPAPGHRRVINGPRATRARGP